MLAEWNAKGARREFVSYIDTVRFALRVSARIKLEDFDLQHISRLCALDMDRPS